MDEVLEELNETPGVQGSLIIGKDGLVIANAGDTEPDPDFLGAETAELFQNAEARMGDKFERGTLGMLSLEADNGHMFLKGINEVTYLLVLTQHEINLGLVRHDIKRASARLLEHL